MKKYYPDDDFNEEQFSYIFISFLYRAVGNNRPMTTLHFGCQMACDTLRIVLVSGMRTNSVWPANNKNIIKFSMALPPLFF